MDGLDRVVNIKCRITANLAIYPFAFFCEDKDGKLSFRGYIIYYISMVEANLGSICPVEVKLLHKINLFIYCILHFVFVVF